MSDNTEKNLPDIFSRVLRAGRRTYFFDVRETRAGDYYLTITESKKTTSEDGDVSYRKHKIYLYKEDFSNFREDLTEAMDFIVKEKGQVVISESHKKDYLHQENHEESDNESNSESEQKEDTKTDTSDFTDVSFDDI